MMRPVAAGLLGLLLSFMACATGGGAPTSEPPSSGEVEHTLHGGRAHVLDTLRGPVREHDADGGGDFHDIVRLDMALWSRGADGAWRMACLVGDYE